MRPTQPSQVMFPRVRMHAQMTLTTSTITIHTAVHAACVETALSAVVTPTIPEAEKNSMQIQTAREKNSSPGRPARTRPTSASEYVSRCLSLKSPRTNADPVCQTIRQVSTHK